MEATNAQRSEKAYRAVLAYYAEGSVEEENITDLMTDLLHLSNDYSSAEEMHRRAWHHYKAESC